MDARAIQARLQARGYAIAADGVLGPQTYATLFAFVGRQAPSPIIAGLGAAAASWLPAAEIATPLRLAHALSQWAVETGGLAKLEENLNYSAERLTKVWPARFPTIAAAAPFAHNPEALANKAYGGRNGNTQPGDGWLYRGRGLTMLTGRANYRDAARQTGLDLERLPDMVAEPDIGLRVACAYWTARDINAAADRDDVQLVRHLVNGGSIGIEEAEAFLARAKLVLL